jgi:hypothetical protein
MANTYKLVNLGGGGGGTADDKKVKVSSDDSNSGFLQDKIEAASDKVVVDVINPGTNEKVTIDVDPSKVDHDALLNYEADEHVPKDDTVTTTDNLWSADKIQTELDTKVDKIVSTDNALSKFDE